MFFSAFRAFVLVLLGLRRRADSTPLAVAHVAAAARMFVMAIYSPSLRRSGLHVPACGVSVLSCCLSVRPSFLSLILVCLLSVWFLFFLVPVVVAGSFLCFVFLLGL